MWNSTGVLASNRQHRHAVLILAVSSALLTTMGQASAQNTATQDAAIASANQTSSIEETVIVASRVPLPIDEIGVSVDRIDRDTMDLLGYVDIAQLLDLQTGISVTRDGGLGKTANVRIRGEEGYRTRILLDGIDIADPSSPQISPRVEQLLTDGLQSVEILRGPQGLAYGADAGGVVALTSQKPVTGRQINIGIETGSDAFQRGKINLALGSAGLRGALSATHVSTDGFNARVSDQNNPDDDGYRNTTLHASVDWSVNDNWKVGGSAHGVEGDNDYDGCFDALTFAPINDCTDDYSQRAWRLFGRWNRDGLSSQVSVEENHIERGFFSAGMPSFETEGSQQEISWLGNLQLANGRRITAGIDIQQQELDAGSDQEKRDNQGYHAEYQQQLFAGVITAGIRHDDNDDYGNHTSWRVSTVQPLSTTLPVALRAAVGTGFRAPSLYELAYNRGPFSFEPASSTNLQEETSRGWEVGLDVGSTGKKLSATWFDQIIDNEIYFDLQTFAGYLQRNGEATSHGLELAGESNLGNGFGLTANLTWNETEDFSGNQRPFRPELTAAASLGWQNSWLRTAMTARTARDSVDTLGNPVDDYSLLDWSIIADLNESLSVNLRAENLTDSDYRQIPDYNTPSRRWFVGVNYQL